MKKRILVAVMILLFVMSFSAALCESIENWDPFGTKRVKFENKYYVATLPEGEWEAYPDEENGVTYYYGDNGNLLFLTQEIPISEKDLKKYTYTAFYDTLLESSLGEISVNMKKEDITVNNHPAILFTYRQDQDGMLINSAGAMIFIDGHALGIFYRDLARSIDELKSDVKEICQSIEYKLETKSTGKTTNESKKASINKKEYSQLPYKKVLRNPNDHIGNKYYIKGEIVQEILEDANTAYYLIATEKKKYVGYSGGYVYVMVSNEDGAFPYKERPLEEDVVNVYGLCMGDYSYTTTLGSGNRVPALYAEWIDITK